MNNFKLTRNKILGNIIEFESDGSVQEIMYDVSDKIADIIEDLQKKAEHQKQMIKSQYGTIKSINKTSQNRKEAIKSLLVQNEKLKKKVEQLKNNRDKAIEILYKRKHVENLFGGVENSNTDKIIHILKGDSDYE